MSFWLTDIRSRFPAIGHDRVYLDNAATTHKPESVIEAVRQLMMYDTAPLYRGFYAESEGVTARYEQVRRMIAERIGAHDPTTIVLTRGATDGLNTIARSWLMPQLKAGDTIVITALEHHANSLPWYAAAARVDAQVVTIPVDPHRLSLELAMLPALITERTRLVSIPLSSNVRGPLTDGELAAIIYRARAVGAAVCFDAAQVVGHAPLFVERWDPDFIVWSGHKMFAPTGSGVLYVAPRLHDALLPSEFGGGMVRNAATSVWEPMPRLLEAGSRSPEAIIGLGATYDFLYHDAQYERIRAHEQALMEQLLDGLMMIAGIRILGDPEILRATSSLVTFVIDGIHAHDLAFYCAQQSIAVRAGNHCCQSVHDLLGLSQSVRVSCALYTSPDDIDRFLTTLRRAVHLFA